MNPEQRAEVGALKRVLSRRDLILYGLVILTPTAPYPVFGIVQTLSGGHAALCYLIAMVAMLFTALSYGKMSGVFPSAGSTYTYVSEGLHPTAGFLAGWSMILDYTLIPLLSVLYAALTAARMAPRIPYVVWAILFTALVTMINIRGVRVSAVAGNIMMVAMSGCALAFAVFCTRFIHHRDGWHGIFSTMPGPVQAIHPHSLMLGAAIASLSFIGFDAISTLAEDTIHPERDISAATIIVCLLETVFCVVTVFLAGRAWPDARTYPNADTAILDIGHRVGGAGLMGYMSLVLLVAGLASALTGQAGASRLLFGMSRDGVLPRRLFAYISPKYSTPVRGIYLMGLITLIGSVALRFQLVVELLNFGAFVGFILVNLSVIQHFYFSRQQRQGWCVLTNLLFPLAGAVVCGFIWFNLTWQAKLAGFAWLGLGVVYLGVLTRGFRRQPKRLTSLTEV